MRSRPAQGRATVGRWSVSGLVAANCGHRLRDQGPSSSVGSSTSSANIWNSCCSTTGLSRGAARGWDSSRITVRVRRWAMVRATVNPRPGSAGRPRRRYVAAADRTCRRPCVWTAHRSGRRRSASGRMGDTVSAGAAGSVGDRLVKLRAMTGSIVMLFLTVPAEARDAAVGSLAGAERSSRRTRGLWPGD